MKYFRLRYLNNPEKADDIVKGKNSLEIIRKYNLCTREHVNTRIIELSGEQEAIAQANEYY